MAEIDVLKAQVVRDSPSIGWGITLQGGGGQPLTIYRVVPGSPVAKIGLKSGDVVTEIGDASMEGVSAEEASNYINQHTDSLILTVERRAYGRIPTNPVMTASQQNQPKFYQTLDMSGAGNPSSGSRQRQRVNPPPHQQQLPPQQHEMNNYNFPTAVSRPFVEPVSRPLYQPPPQHLQQIPSDLPPLKAPPRQPGYHTPPLHSPTQRVPEEDRCDSGVSQSRTFRVLSSLMANEEPYSGVQGLPPQRSATMERMKQDWVAQQHDPKQRVKVLMPQQYNNPMSLYSAPNVVQTFAQQATGIMNEIESKAAAEDEATMSNVQQAVKSENFQP